MGFFKELQNGWKAMNRYEKINFIIDLVCRTGASITGMTVGKALTKDTGKVQTICVRTFTTGLGMAAGKAASKELQFTPEQIEQLKKLDEERQRREELRKEREQEVKVDG